MELKIIGLTVLPSMKAQNCIFIFSKAIDHWKLQNGFGNISICVSIGKNSCQKTIKTKISWCSTIKEPAGLKKTESS